MVPEVLRRANIKVTQESYIKTTTTDALSAILPADFLAGRLAETGADHVESKSKGPASVTRLEQVVRIASHSKLDQPLRDLTSLSNCER